MKATKELISLLALASLESGFASSGSVRIGGGFKKSELTKKQKKARAAAKRAKKAKRKNR